MPTQDPAPVVDVQDPQGQVPPSVPTSDLPSAGAPDEADAPYPEHTPQVAANDVGNGVADASPSSDTAPESSEPEPGQAPTTSSAPLAHALPPVSSIPTAPSPPNARPEASDRARAAGEDRASLTTSTHTHTRTPSTRRKDTTSASENAHTASTLGSNEPRKAKASKKAKAKSSLLSRILHVLVPCVGPSTRAHEVEFEKPSEPPLTQVKEKEPVKPAASAPPLPVAEPPALVPAEAVADVPREPEASAEPFVTTEASVEPSASPEASAEMTPSKETQIPPPLQAIDIPPPSDDPSVVVPPTPTKILPREETGGVLSGAVQPPGSTGEESVQDQGRQRDSDHDSDGSTSFTEDEDMEEGVPIDEVEDEEERLILNGGAGIPIGPDGVPRPLLPPLSPKHAGRKCLVLDLDETLVHSSFKSIQQADYVVPVEIEYHWHNVYVIKRPGVDNFLKKMGEIYEVVVFTASLSKYADPVLDKLDIHHVVAHRLFRESCYNHRGNYVKDLSQLGRPIGDTIIIDNSPASYIFHPNNAVPVSSWFNDPHDTELTDLVPFLADLSQVDDVRGVLDGGL